MERHERRRARTARDLVRIAVPLLASWGVGLAVMAAVASQPDDRAGQLLMDPSFTLGSRWYTGLVSNLGILAWTIGAAAAFAGAWLCKLGGRSRAGRFLTAGGVVGALLLADDLFQFHAVLLPAELDVPKALGQAALGGCVLAWLVMNLAEIRRTHVHLLVAAAAALAGSFVVDAVYAPLPGSGWNVVEDGAKFLGILAWSAYFVATTRDISRSVFTDALLTWPDEAYDSVYGALDEFDATAIATTEVEAATSDEPAHLG